MVRLKDLLPLSLFKNKRIAIPEHSFADATFILHSLLEIYDNLRIVSFYRNKQYYEEQGIIAETVFEKENERKEICDQQNDIFRIRDRLDQKNMSETKEISDQKKIFIETSNFEEKVDKSIANAKDETVSKESAPTFICHTSDESNESSSHQMNTSVFHTKPLLIDDYYTANHVLLLNLPSTISIYRSDSFDYKYSDHYDLIFQVSPLKSGISEQFHGELKVLERDVVHLAIKYKTYYGGVTYIK